eukprot:5626540-Pyramimonas_sp.AAC.1
MQGPWSAMLAFSIGAGQQSPPRMGRRGKDARAGLESCSSLLCDSTALRLQRRQRRHLKKVLFRLWGAPRLWGLG